MSYLHDLALRKPQYFTETELAKLLEKERFASYVSEITAREYEFVTREKSNSVLNGRRERKLISGGTPSTGPK